MADGREGEERDELAESLNDLFTNLSSMVKSELQGTGNLLQLLEKMNLKVAEEYQNFGDIASGLRVFVEQLKAKNGSFHEYVQQIDSIERQVTEFEAIISMLDNYVRLLETKVRSAYQDVQPKTIN
ncbi:biogenesis of lysosome-related organelles complex 1 subunit 2 isoform X1 [Nymphaea colorata]|nr:biogenesis of lysosome-related organelles complex 1 subunit 2 isoform X1 [Nymphaea colorata]